MLKFAIIVNTFSCIITYKHLKLCWGLFNGLQFLELTKVSLKIIQNFIHKDKSSDSQAQTCFSLSQIRFASEKHFTTATINATKIPSNKLDKIFHAIWL